MSHANTSTQSNNAMEITGDMITSKEKYMEVSIKYEKLHIDDLHTTINNIINRISRSKEIRHEDIHFILNRASWFSRLWQYPNEFLKTLKISYENEEVCPDPFPYSSWGKGGILTYDELSKYYISDIIYPKIWKSINDPWQKKEMMTDYVKMKSFIKFIISFKMAFNMTPWQMIDAINNIITYRTIVGGSTTKERNNMKKSIKLYGKFTKEYFKKMFGYKLNYDKPTFNKTEMSDFISHTLFIVNDWDRVANYTYYHLTHRNIFFDQPEMFNRSDLKHHKVRCFWLKLENNQETKLGEREINI